MPPLASLAHDGAEQGSPAELAVQMGMFYWHCPVWWPPVICDYCVSEELNFNFKINNWMWPVATVLKSTGVERSDIYRGRSPKSR